MKEAPTGSICYCGKPNTIVHCQFPRCQPDFAGERAMVQTEGHVALAQSTPVKKEAE